VVAVSSHSCELLKHKGFLLQTANADTRRRVGVSGAVTILLGVPVLSKLSQGWQQLLTLRYVLLGPHSRALI
jgi:hypothetical protein